MEISISRNIGPSEHVQYFVFFLVFLIENDMMPRERSSLPPKNDVFAQSRASKFKTEIETKRQFPVLLAACLSQTTGGAFCLDECPKNVISCNII